MLMAITLGARSCIGKRLVTLYRDKDKGLTFLVDRFSETEAVPIIALIIARYRVEIQDEPQFASETFEQRRERVLAGEQNITLT